MTCICEGCARPSTRDSDECREHLLAWEREQGDAGETESPCREGHYGCAHYEGGACHGYQPDPDSTLCPDGKSNCRF